MVSFLSSSLGLVAVAASAAILAICATALFGRALIEDAPSEPAGAGLARVALAGVLVSAGLVVPLIFTIASPDVFVLPKLIALSGTLLAGLALIRLGATRLPRAKATAPSRTTLVIETALIAYVALTTLATITSIDPGVSIVGQYEQYQGLPTTLLYVAFFWLARNALASGRRLCLMTVATTIGAAIVAGYAVLQALHLDPIWGILDQGGVFSTLGQHEWLGDYLAVCLALGFALLWQVRPPARLVIGLTLGLILAALLLTLSRGAYLAAGVAAAVFLIALVPGARPTRGWLLALPVLAMGVVLVGALPPVRDEVGVVVTRAGSTAALDENSIAMRLDMWNVAAAITIDHPLLGTGPDTFSLLFDQYRDRILASRRDFWMGFTPESPHNAYLAIAAGCGLPALAAYLVLLAAVFTQLVRALRRTRSRATRAILAAVLAAASGHLVADFFMTADLTGTWLVWLLLGAGVGYAESLLRAPTPIDSEGAIANDPDANGSDDTTAVVPSQNNRRAAMQSEETWIELHVLHDHGWSITALPVSSAPTGGRPAALPAGSGSRTSSEPTNGRQRRSHPTVSGSGGWGARPRLATPTPTEPGRRR
jgi:O-antigen ligase